MNNKKLRKNLRLITYAVIAALMVTTVVQSVYAVAAHSSPGFMLTSNHASHSVVYVKKGSSAKLTARFLESGDSVKSFSSSNTKVATVSKTGKVKAKNTGTATITAKTAKNKKDTVKIKVVKKTAPVKSLKLPSKLTLGISSVYRPAITISPTKATSTLSWSSSNKSVATVNSAGYIATRKMGTTTITVKSSNGKTSKCKVTVQEPISISAKNATLRMGKTLKLSASAPSGNIKWSSSASSIAAVDSTGKITPKKTGTVTITAKAASGATAQCAVTIVPHIPSTGVTVSPTSATVYAGNTKAIKATMTAPAGASMASNDDITWTTSNSKVATVNSSGTVTGVGFGTATITATTESGFSAKTTVAGRTIKAKQSDYQLTPGTRAIKTFTIYGSDSVTKYTSSNTSVATVSSSGYITANYRNKTTGNAVTGTTTITATTATGDTAKVSVKVVNDPTVVDLSYWNGSIDWEKASMSIDLAILRVSDGITYLDSRYFEYADACKKYGIPFGIYSYSRYTTKAKAQAEAEVVYKQAIKGGRSPAFFVVDAEESFITRTNTEAYIAKLRSLAGKRIKVGVYAAHHLYTKMNLNLATDTSNSKTPDFVWIPRYSYANNGSITNVPAPNPSTSFICDMWQYSSGGSLPGISGSVDMNTLYFADGTKISQKPTFTLQWLSTPA